MSLATLREMSVAVLLEGLRHVRRDAKFYFAGSSGMKWGLNPRPVDLHFSLLLHILSLKFCLNSSKFHRYISAPPARLAYILHVIPVFSQHLLSSKICLR